MSNSIKDLINAVKKGTQAMIDNRQTDALRIAFDQLALIKLRVQSRGERPDGSAYTPPYSVAYKKERTRAGFQTDYIDFTRTGRMFADVRPNVVDSNLISTTVEIKASLPNEQKKLEVNTTRRGAIIESSPDEIKLVRDANIQRIKSYFKNI
jgi:hypothetical protein